VLESFNYYLQIALVPDSIAPLTRSDIGALFQNFSLQ